MANIKSSKKDVRRTVSRTERNRTVRSRIKTLSKEARSATDAASIESASSKLVSALDKAAKSGIVHKNKVARVKSRIAKAANKAAAK